MLIVLPFLDLSKTKSRSSQDLNERMLQNDAVAICVSVSSKYAKPPSQCRTPNTVYLSMRPSFRTYNPFNAKEPALLTAKPSLPSDTSFPLSPYFHSRRPTQSFIEPLSRHAQPSPKIFSVSKPFPHLDFPLPSSSPPPSPSTFAPTHYLPTASTHP